MGTVRRLDDHRGIAVRRFRNGEGATSIAASLGRSVGRVPTSGQPERRLAGQTGRPIARDARTCRRRPCRPRWSKRCSSSGSNCTTRESSAGHRTSNGAWRTWRSPRAPRSGTIGRILAREGLTHRRTGRYTPKGTPYPALPAVRVNQVHQLDYVGPCYLAGPVRFWSRTRWTGPPSAARSSRSPRGRAKRPSMPSGRAGTAWGSRKRSRSTTSWSSAAATGTRTAWAPSSASACPWGSSRGSFRFRSRGGTASWNASTRTSGASSWPGSRCPTSPGCGRPVSPSKRGTTAGTAIHGCWARPRWGLLPPLATRSASRRRRRRRLCPCPSPRRALSPGPLHPQRPASRRLRRAFPGPPRGDLRLRGGDHRRCPPAAHSAPRHGANSGVAVPIALTRRRSVCTMS